MKRVDSETLQFVNKTNTSDFKSGNSKENLIELCSSGDTEFMDSFGDKALEFFGSDNITKNSALEILDEESIKFVEKDDIEEAYKSVDDIVIRLKNGEVFRFEPAGNSYKLVYYANGQGESCSLDGLSKIWENIHSDKKITISPRHYGLSNISIVRGTLILEIMNGVQVFYDTNSKEITDFRYNDSTFPMSEIKRAFEARKQERVKEARERVRNGSNHPLYEKWKEELEATENMKPYDVNKADNIHFGDDYVAIDGTYIFFENGKATLMSYYYRPKAMYTNGYTDLEL